MTTVAAETVPASTHARQEALRDLENDATDRARQLQESIQLGVERLARLRAARRQLINEATTFRNARHRLDRRTP